MKVEIREARRLCQKGQNGTHLQIQVHGLHSTWDGSALSETTHLANLDKAVGSMHFRY